MNEPDLDARDGTEECAAFQKAASVTSDAVTDLNCTDSLTLNNSTIIKRVFLRAEDTNGEGYELATCCRGEGENVMLTERKLVGEDTLNEYAIEVWNDRRIEKTEDLWEYALHPNPYFKLSTIGKVSGMVQVIREDMEGELHIGSPMAGRSRRGSMRVTRHL